jgi:pilus assembly protein Flp/PilA
MLVACQLLLTQRTSREVRNTNAVKHMEKSRMSKVYTKLNSAFQALKSDERGQDMVEYTILTGMIVVAIIASIGTVATWVQTKWSTLAGALT